MRCRSALVAVVAAGAVAAQRTITVYDPAVPVPLFCSTDGAKAQPLRRLYMARGAHAARDRAERCDRLGGRAADVAQLYG